MFEQCEFFIVRYFADPIRDEPINIGIILLAVGESGNRAPLVRITKNWKRVRCIDPRADIEMLALLEESLQARLTDAGLPGRAAVEKLDQSLSTSLRLARANAMGSVTFGGIKGALTDNFAEEIDRLMALYVEERIDESDSESGEIEAND